MSQTLWDKLVSGLVSNQANDCEVAGELHRNIVQFVSARVPGRIREGEISILRAFPEDTPHARLAEVAVRYHQQTDGHLGEEVLSRVLSSRGLPGPEVTRTLLLFDACAREEVDEHAFKFWLREAVDTVRAVPVAEALANAMQALETGYTDPRTQIQHQGPDGAWEILDAARAVPGMTSAGVLSMPGGDIRRDKGAVLREVEEAESGVQARGVVLTGFRFVDDTVQPQAGDVVLIGAHTGEGKSQFCSNWAWHAAVKQGRNVLVLTIETSRERWRRRCIVRHSNDPGIGRAGGILYENVKRGRFRDDEERALFVRVLNDFCDNPAYGILDITQASNDLRIQDVAEKVREFEDAYAAPCHMVMVDYLSLMAPRTRRRERRDEVNEILQESKTFATSHASGRGILFVSPHQTKTAVREDPKLKPEDGKFYKVTDFADTSEAGKTIDIGIMALRTPELQAVHELAVGLVKVRDAGFPTSVYRLYENYATSFLGNLA